MNNLPVADKLWVCEFGTLIVEEPDESGDCRGCNGRQDVRGCGWWSMLPHGDAARIREAIARIISNDTIHGAPEAAADRVMRDVLNIGDNDGHTD